MRLDELHAVIKWATDENWNVGLYDKESFYQSDPGGFIIGLLNGEPIGSIWAVSYDANFGFIGRYLVRRDMRGRGYGMRLWNAGMKHLAYHVIGVDAVQSRESDYAKSGFRSAYNVFSYSGTKRVHDAFKQPGLITIDKVPFEELIRFDRQHFPSERINFLKAWICQPESRGFAVMDTQGLRGFGIARPSNKGWKIGPLFASDREVAKSLLNALAASIPETDKYYLEIPENNPQAISMAEDQGMRTDYGTIRMYRGVEPNFDYSGVYSVMSSTLG